MADDTLLTFTTNNANNCDFKKLNVLKSRISVTVKLVLNGIGIQRNPVFSGKLSQYYSKPTLLTYSMEQSPS